MTENYMTVKEWMELVGSTAAPDDINGDVLDESDTITISPNGEEYCVGEYNGSQTWIRFDGEMVLGDTTGGWENSGA